MIFSDKVLSWVYGVTMTTTENLSYPVRKGLEAANRASAVAGYKTVRTTPPPFGYYVTNEGAVNWDGLRRSQAVTETQQQLATVSSGMRNEYETAVYDAARAFYEYTNPSGAKVHS